MPRWHQPYLGLTEFPADLTTFELDFFFTFKPNEIEALKSRYKPLLRIGAAIQLGFLKMAGCAVTSFKVVPRTLLHYIGQQLGEAAPSIASLRSLYKKRRRTLYEHQTWAIQLLGLADMAERQERMLFARLRDMARSSSSRDLLTQFASEWLYEHKLLIPAERRLRSLARRAMIDVEQDRRNRLREAALLRARRMRRRRPSRFADLREPRRTLEVVCFLRMALLRTTDAILHMTRQRTADLMREARDEAVSQDARNALTYREAVQAIRAFVEDTALDAESARDKIRYVLAQLQPKAYESRAAAVRDRLLDKGPAIRALLRSVTTLPIEGATQDPFVSR